MGRTTWLRRAPLLVAAATMTGFGLTGIASAQTITNTGPDSNNRIETKVSNRCDISNNNDVSVKNSNRQYAASGDAGVYRNTGGLSWGGWSSLDPATAQADGLGYSAWRNNVTGWMAQHGTGDGWNSAGDNLSWAPAGNDWSGYDPTTWQANGQSFGNWWNGTQSYLDANSPAWLLGWPAGDNGGGGIGGGSAVSGDASNSNSTNFTIRINNAASTAAGVNACGQSLFTPPPVGGKGGGPGAVIPGTVTTAKSATPGRGAGGAGGAGGFGGISSVSRQPGASRAVTTPAVTTTPAHVTPPTGGAGSTTPVVTHKVSISNTGPESINKITTTVTNKTTVTNNNNVCITNTNSQKASSGDASVSGNTNAGSSGSGSAENGNGTGVGASLTN